MDRLCALSLVAADAALFEAGLSLEALARRSSDRIGLVVGTRFGCHATNEEYFRGLLAEGPHGASPRLFVYTLPSSPVGELAIHFGARGPSRTVTSGRHAGLEAIARGAELCASGRADVVVAVAVEVGGGALVGDGCGDGAAAVVIEVAEEARSAGRNAVARFAGEGLAFSAGRPDEALAAAEAIAVARAGLPPRALPRLSSPSGSGAVDAAGPLADWLVSRPDEGTAALALASDEAGGAAALLVVGAQGRAR
jgi:3-oxoacyl-[acyl-carrier-protein] synthase II